MPEPDIGVIELHGRNFVLTFDQTSGINLEAHGVPRRVVAAILIDVAADIIIEADEAGEEQIPQAFLDKLLRKGTE